MLKTFCRPVSLTGLNGKRVRVSRLPAGSALCAVVQPQPPVTLAAPQPIVGYWYRCGHLTVYVNGPMPPGLRTACEEQRTHEEVLLQEPLPTGIREIDLTDCRREYRLHLAA